MKKVSVYICKACGYQSGGWLGQCPYCQAWESFEETSPSPYPAGEAPLEAKRLSELKEDHEERLRTGLNEVNRVLGGGLVPGSVSLLAGSPGVGKSTLLLQLAASFSDEFSVLYVSAEESLNQVKLRAVRLGLLDKNVSFVHTNDLTAVLDCVSKLKPKILIVDSVQALNSFPGEVPLGTPTQLRLAAERICQSSRRLGTAAVLSGHVTKEGIAAGPKLLEHMVDAVFYLETGKNSFFRHLWSEKNRFGNTMELAFFTMGERGLEEMKNPGSIFSEMRKPSPGRAFTIVFQGTRPLLVEMEALVTKASTFPPRRQALGIDYQRLIMDLAIVEKRLGLPLSQYDVFANIGGGIQLKDSEIDLALILAVLSSKKNVALPSDMLAMGEVSLTGDVRSNPFIQEKAREAVRQGFKKLVLPSSAKKLIKKPQEDTIFIDSIKEVNALVS